MALDLPSIIPPTNWDDGLDWSNPDVGDVRYFQALHIALTERFSTPAGKMGLSALRAVPWPTQAVAGVGWYAKYVEALRTIASKFIIPQRWGNYAADLSDFPKHWSWKSMLNAIGNPSMVVPTRGVPLHDSGELLKNLKALVSLLSLCAANTDRGVSTLASKWAVGYSQDDPSYAEAWRQAKEEADNMAASREWDTEFYRIKRYRFYCYSTFQLWGVQYEGSPAEKYYKAEIDDSALKIEKLKGVHGNDRPAMVALVSAKMPESPALNGELCDLSFDAADTAFRENEISEMRFPYDALDACLHGPMANVPQAPAPAESPWVPDGPGKQMPMSYSRKGFVAEAVIFFDYTDTFKFK